MPCVNLFCDLIWVNIYNINIKKLLNCHFHIFRDFRIGIITRRHRNVIFKPRLFWDEIVLRMFRNIMGIYIQFRNANAALRRRLVAQRPHSAGVKSLEPLQDHIPMSGVLHRPPVQHVPWSESPCLQIGLDLTRGENIVPHVLVCQLAGERLLGIKTPTIGILVLAEDNERGSRDGATCMERPPDTGSPIEPNLHQTCSWVPRSTERVPLIQLTCHPVKEHRLVSNPKWNVVIVKKYCEAVGPARGAQGERADGGEVISKESEADRGTEEDLLQLGVESGVWVSCLLREGEHSSSQICQHNHSPILNSG